MLSIYSSKLFGLFHSYFDCVLITYYSNIVSTVPTIATVQY